MRTIFHVYSDRFESEAFFDADGTKLASWACNDAHWRQEYMNPFLRALGYVVKNAPQWLVDRTEAEWLELWGDPGD